MAYHFKLRVPLGSTDASDGMTKEERHAENKLGYMRCLEALGEWYDMLRFLTNQSTADRPILSSAVMVL